MAKVAVIGSGLGGLAAALTLARAGETVSLFERQSQVGGYAIHFRRKGFTFDPALHAIPAGGPDQAFGALIAGLGMAGKVSFVRLAQGPRIQVGDQVFDLPNQFGEVYAWLESRFPSEVPGIRRFRRCLEGAGRIYAAVLVGRPGFLDWVRFILHLPVFLRRSFQSTKEFFDRFFDDPLLRLVMYSYAVFMGIPTGNFPAVNYIMMTSMLLDSGMWSIAGGGGTLTRLLVEEFRALGGQVHTGCGVKAFKLVGRSVRSVVDDRGHEHPVDAVMANLNLPDLVQLCPRGSLPAAWSQSLGRFRPSISVVQLHLGLDCPVAELGIDHYLGFWFPDADLDACIRRNRDNLLPEGWSLTAPGLADPATLANNDRVLSLVGAVSGERWLALDPDAYAAAKAQCRDLLLGQLEARHPGLLGHIVVEDLATPCTFHRYTGNPQGALMGFECHCGDHRELAALSDFPLDNVHLASAWTDRLGGFMQSMKAGVAAAQAWLEHAR